jgi:hypothetical protein
MDPKSIQYFSVWWKGYKSVSIDLGNILKGLEWITKN